MIPEIPPSTTGSSKRRFSRARKRQALIGAALGGLLVVTAVVIVASVTGGSRSGTLASGATGIDSFDPTNGLVNDEVHIVGAGFTGATDVRFNGVSVTSFNVISDTEIATLVPEGAVKGPITVDTPSGDLVSADDFRPGAPIIRDFSPLAAAAGTTITVNGYNLDGVTTVKINGTETKALNASSTSVQAVVPANASSGLISVATDNTRASSDDPIQITSPSIADFQPHFGAPGTQVTLTGANLSGMTAVQFNGTAGQVVSTASDGTSAIIAPPASFTAGPITVTTPAGKLVTDDSFGTGPIITSISPATAPVGSTVTITGKYFTGAVSVSFASTNGASAPFSVVSDTQITVTVPDAAGNGPITVVAGGSTASATSITIAGSIQNFSPDSGPAGTSVAIYGRGFTGATAVRFNGTGGLTMKVVSDTKITATVPWGATTGTITVVTPTGTLTSADSYKVGAVAAVVPSYDWTAPAAVPYSPDAGAPLGGTDFSKSATAKVSGITFTAITSTSTTTTSSTTTIVKATTTAVATTAAATTTTAAATTSTAAGTTTPTTAAAATITTIAQVPFTGTATVAIGGATTFTAKVTYTDRSNWTVTPSTTSQSLTFPVAGKTMTVTALTGSITASNGNITWGLKGTGSLTTLIANKFALNAGSTVYFTGTCPFGFSTVLCSSAAGPFARIDGNSTTSGMKAVVGNVVPDQTALAYQAAVDLKSKVFNLDGTYPAGSLVTIQNARLRMAYKDKEWAKTDTDVVIESGTVNDGLDIIVTGKSHVDVPYIGGFNPPSVTVWYLDGGSMLTFRFPTKRVIGEASMGSAAFLTGHGSPVQATVGGEARQLTDSAWVFVGSMRMPSYVQRAFKVESGEVLAVATMTGNGFTEVKGMFRTPIELPKLPYVKTAFEGFEAGLRFDESNPDLSVEAFAGASGTIEIADNAPVAVALEVAFSFGEEFSWSIALTASGTDGRALWPDMFGVRDFDLDKVSIEATFIGFELVGVGLAGNGTLPGKLLEYMGASDGLPQPASFVANLSAVDPCLQVTAGTPDNTDALFSFPPETGAISINYFRITASPNGCMVGVFDVPAGVVIAEKGTFFGVKRDYLLAFNPNPTGPPGKPKTPSFYGWDASQTNLDKGAIKFNYRITWGAGGWNLFPYLYINGLLKLGNNADIEVHGGCIILVGMPNCYAEGTGVIDLGKGLSARLKVKADGIGTPVATYVGAGDLNLFGLKFGLTGSFTALGSTAPLGWDFSATVDLPGKSNLVDQLGVRVGYGVRKNAFCLTTYPGSTCKKWLTDPLFSLTISGDTGGLFTLINGAADAFGAAPVSKGGRYSLRESWSPDWSSLSFHGSSSISLGTLGTVSADVGFYFCLSTSCFGNVSGTFGFDYKKGGKTWTFTDIPIAEDWGFNFSKSYTDSFSESGKVGDSWGGLKGTVSGSIDVSLTVKYPPVSASLKLDFDLRAKAYVGAGGEWNYLGSYGVSYDSGGDRFCFSASGDKVCV